ncbi:MAG: nicotinate-nucleotide adenylyltransferase [Clostridium sp.]|nr:nicotinate-nucleotide adenylyltransferase [Clostridium sp.]
MAAIGIMGGTFNPIHLGHTAIAKAAYEQFNLDEIWFMPNHLPAYKSNKDLVSAEDRLKMVQLGIQKYPYFKVSDFEIKREGRTYTYKTMLLLSQKYPQNQFYFIMGADSLFYFDKWQHPEMIVAHATILAATRNQKSTEEMLSQIDKLNTQFNTKSFHLIQCPEMDCSSSEIREKFSEWYQRSNTTDNRTSKNDKDAEHFFLSEEVFSYIIERKLYINSHA